MTITDDVGRLMELYPRIFFACHQRHRRDPKTRAKLSSHQGSILDHLDDVEPTSLTRLAEHMGVTPSTMSLAIDRLEAAGYVRRGRDRLDGRRVLLRLSKSGVRLKEVQSVLEPDRVKSMLARLSEEERRRAVDGLALLAGAALQDMHSRSSQRAWRRGSPV